jgi:hypothetical protein
LELTGPLGTYVQNRDAAEEFFAWAIREARLEAWQRTRPSAPPETGLGLLKLLTPAVDKALGAADRESLYQRGLEAMLALEQFRCERGDYPELLSELVPRHLAAEPTDPWSGRPLRYRRLDARERGRPAYLLYSIGPDGTDNGGAASVPGGESFRGSDGAPGTDLVISAARNDPAAAPAGPDE